MTSILLSFINALEDFKIKKEYENHNSFSLGF